MEIKTSNVAHGNNLLNIGDYGKVGEVPDDSAWPEPARFPWFGVEIRVHPMLSDTILIDLIEESGDLDDKDPRGAMVVKQFIRDVIHPDDFDDFWKLGKANGYQTAQFAEVAAGIVTAVTGDPTQESSDSSNGQSPTATKSQAVSSKVTRTIEELEREGRPDLAEFFLLAREHGVSH